MFDFVLKERPSLKIGAGALLVRVVLMPAVILCVARYLPLVTELKQVLVVQAAMPAARRANSKEVSFSRCLPTPLVKNSSAGTKPTTVCSEEEDSRDRTPGTSASSGTDASQPDSPCQGTQ